MAFKKIEIVEGGFSFYAEEARSIRVEDNALTFDDTVYQISNISKATVWRKKNTIKKMMPLFLLLLFVAFGVSIISVSSETQDMLLVFLVMVVGLFFFFDSQLERSNYTYYLLIELNSGITYGFKDENQDFLEEVAYRLHSVIRNPSYAAGFVVYFNSNQIIEIYNDFSNHVEGDVLNSFINSGIANGVQGRWSA